MSASLVFVACVEPGRLESQTVLLCRSIRRFAGRHRNAGILVLQPRRTGDLRPATRAALADAGAELHRVPLNDEFPSYPIANKAFAAEWAERGRTEDVIVFADSDSVLAGEPRALELAGGASAAVRPVNAKNIGTAGPEDPDDEFWTRVHARFGTQPPPLVRTTVTREMIHGYWNAGLVAVRRDAGLMARWREVLEALLRWGIAYRGGWINHHDQVALAVALAPAATEVLDPRHNYPLPLRHRLPAPEASRRLDELVHVHYFRALHAPGFLDTLEPPLHADCEVARLLRDHAPLDPVGFGSEPRRRYTP
jgi:hypothetical protein